VKRKKRQKREKGKSQRTKVEGRKSLELRDLPD
jgi:hypothetical protein